MSNTRAKPMLEGGLLAGLLVVIAVASIYIPFANIVWSLPIALIGARHGVRYSMLTAIVGTIVITLSVHILQGMFLFLGGGLTGIVLGECLYRRMSGAKTVLLTMIASGLSLLALVGATMVMMQLDAVQFIGEMQSMILEAMREVSQSMAGSDAERAEMLALGEEMEKLYVQLLPTGFVLYALLCTVVNLMLACAVMRRMQMKIPQYTPFAMWRLPGWVLYLFVLALVGNYWGHRWLSDAMVAVAQNVQILTLVALFMQGVAVLYYVKCQNTFVRRIWWILVLLGIISPVFEIAFVVLGGIDILVNYRKIGEKQV